MAAGNVTVYTQAATELGQGGFDLATDAFQVALLTQAYTPSPDSNALWSDVSTYEVAPGGGYTADGASLAGQSWTVAGTLSTFGASPTSWPASTITAKYAAIVRRAGVALAPSDLLLCFVDLNTDGGSVSTTGGTLSITWTSGIFILGHAP